MLCPLHCRFRYKTPRPRLEGFIVFSIPTCPTSSMLVRERGMEGLDRSYRGMVSGEAASKAGAILPKQVTGQAELISHASISLEPGWHLSELDWR